MIFCTHRELFKLRPHWDDNPQGQCRGRMVIDPDTEDLDVRVAECDLCGLEIGIPPSQGKRWLDRQGVVL
jgi:hypothetical protein